MNRWLAHLSYLGDVFWEGVATMQHLNFLPIFARSNPPPIPS